MDVLITVVMLASLGVCLYILADYMHKFANMSYKRIAAIMSPIVIILAIMVYLTLTSTC